MTSNTRFPLRLLATDPSNKFQLTFSEQGAMLLAGFSGVQTQASAGGLIINAVAERDLSAAVAMLQAAFPGVDIGTVEVVYLDQGRMEPYVRVNVTTPEDYYGFVIAQLNDRCGLIDSLVDTDSHLKTVSATAPLAKMLGYDKVLAETTRNSATVEYYFVDYRPVQSQSPEPPRRPAARA
jgi:predicted membrane GTPase involved in stress response